jgi:transcriptional regulator with XRE-family HTH domain
VVFLIFQIPDDKRGVVMRKKTNPFKEKIKIEMLKNGYTQTKMAEMLGISNQAFSAWLNGGSPKLETVTKIAQLLGRPANYFFENNGNIATNNSAINQQDSSRLSLLEKDVEILKKEIEILKLKTNKEQWK